MRVAKVSVLIPDCPRCGNPIVVNGFSPEVTCEACNSVIAINGKQWQEVFSGTYKETGETLKERSRQFVTELPGSFSHQVEASGIAGLPCTACGTLLDVKDVAADAQSVHCQGCGSSTQLTLLPRNARKKRSHFGAFPREETEDARLSQLAPVAINCPNCAAVLKINRQNERITNCEFCSGEFLIPDVLWRRLHPVKVAAPWYVLYDMKPPPTPEEQVCLDLIEQKKREIDNLLGTALLAFAGYIILGFLGLVLVGNILSGIDEYCQYLGQLFNVSSDPGQGALALATGPLFLLIPFTAYLPVHHLLELRQRQRLETEKNALAEELKSLANPSTRSGATEAA